jgi:hypothetical protein
MGNDLHRESRGVLPARSRKERIFLRQADRTADRLHDLSDVPVCIHCSGAAGWLEPGFQLVCASRFTGVTIPSNNIPHRPVDEQNRWPIVVTSRINSSALSIVLINAGNVVFASEIFSLKRAFQMFAVDAYFWLAFGSALASILLGASSIHFGTRRIGLEP